MELIYTIPKARYLHLLNGQTVLVADKKGNIKKATRGGLGSLKKVIDYLNETEGLLGVITELRVED